MSTPAETNHRFATEIVAESPTTARPLEMDDDDGQETGVVAADGAISPSSVTKSTESSSQAPPPKPPRPVSEAQQNQTMLKEAFPSVDVNVIRAVLTASGGRVEPAFDALLEMTDPDAVKNEPEDVPPPQPPRPQGQTSMSQLEADELYARQLAEHYDNVGAYEARTANRSAGGRSRSQQEDDRERSFLEDDFPVIRENLRLGFLETQTKVNGWISNLKKKIEDNFDENENENEDASHSEGPQYRRQGEPSRRSNDYDRYDADPQVLSDDFAGMKFSPDGTPAFNNRPMANTGIYRPPPSTSPRPSDGRRVGFKDEPEEINMYDHSPKVPAKDAAPASGSRASKWQPLSTVDPNPITDNDPFSLGDSEDEREIKEKPKDGKADDSERLKQAAAEAMADSLVDKAKGGQSSEKKA